MDVHSPTQRSFNMSQIKSRGTKPEMIVRRMVHRMGYRFRLHKADLPGKPDLVLVRHRKIVEVRGCFFHMHPCKYGRVVPASNSKFWNVKRMSNVGRDQRNLKQLRLAGWRVMIVWECQTKDLLLLAKRLERFLES
jgi:DNA mismatch endonuclease, patch repair protein